MKTLTGKWHIIEMENWDADYFNMDGQAYVEVDEKRGLGTFQFGLVFGQMDGDVEYIQGKDRFSFTWDGNDEMDPVSGRGWLQLVKSDEIEGYIKIHQSDSSMFQAVRV